MYKKLIIYVLAPLCLLTTFFFAQGFNNTKDKVPAADTLMTNLGYKKLEMYDAKKNQSYVFLQIPEIYKEGWNSLNQIVFWDKIMNLTKDSGILNIGWDRDILSTYDVEDWRAIDDTVKEDRRDSIRNSLFLGEDAHIYFTNGKKEFYHLYNVIPYISRAIPIFIHEAVDPFYAQSILLIESPAYGKKSHVGAKGYFQLMPRVAVKMGLEVNRYHDDRTNFDKSAKAAAKLIKTICIPYTDSILNHYNIPYQSFDLWYRLLVLHVYHAGAYNVANAIDSINPQTGGMSLITSLWNTTAGQFRNASQNYSQVALAALINYDQLIDKRCYAIYPCKQ